jgi:hypothetical protein
VIRVIVELHPHGDASRRRVIGEMKVWNDGSGEQTIGNYKFAFWRRSKDTKNRKGKVHQGEVKGFPRLRKNVFELIQLCLSAPEKKIMCECGNTNLIDGVCHSTHVLAEVSATK